MRFIGFLAFTVAWAATAAPADSLNHLQWRLLGPFRGGRSVAVSGVPNDGATFYFGAVDGGVWKTTDAGTTWSPIFDGQPVASIGALAVAASDPNVIYAGTGETDIRSNLASGDGVYRSSDAGRTWRHIGLKDTRQISRIVVSPTDPNVLLVAALGHAYGPNEERGVYLSTDGGESWKQVLDRGPKVGAADLAMATDRPGEIFATMWEAHRPPWSTYAPIGGPGSGLFRTQNGGRSWKEVRGHGLPEATWGRAGVAISPGTRGKRVYAVIEAKDGGVFRSDDGGDSWTLVNKDARLTSRGWYFNSITADPNDPDVVYVPNVALYRLSEGGKALSIVRGAPGGDDYHQLWIDPGSSRRMVLATDQGTSVSLNGGQTWSSWYNQPTAQFYHVITDSTFPYHVYGAQQDSGTGAVPVRSDRGQIDARNFSNVGGSESGYIALDAKDPDIFYVTGTFGTVDRYNRRTMQSQNIAPAPAPSGLAEAINHREMRDPWTPVIVASAKAPFALYLGTQFVMKTLDGGLHWQKISPDLTGAVAGTTEGTPGAPADLEKARALGYGVVYAIAPSPLGGQEIWAGSDSGLVHVTRDGGRKWTNVTPPGLSAFSKVTHIEASHFNAGEAYVAVDRHRLDDRKPYLFRTRDFGKTWTAAAEGIPEPAFLNCIREDSKRQGLLFAATEFGVYVSSDDGDRWTTLQRNLPVTSVRDLAIHGDDLVAATHGRSFWVMDNFSSLRAKKGDAPTEAILFPPAVAVRMKSDAFLGTPLPPEEPQAKNPPAGAMVDYYLPTAAAKVSLDILDGQGKSIRHYASGEAPVAAARTAPIAPRWIEKPRALETAAGSHRFVWDLRYGRSGLPDAGDDDDEDQRWLGPLVIPGQYQARLTVDGKVLSAPVQVTMDPRASVPAAVLAEQFRWALKSFTDMVAARKAAAEMQGLSAKLKALQSNDDAATLERKTAQMLSGGEGSRDGMAYLSRSLTTVLNAIENADRTPPSQVIAMYQDASRNLKPTLATWQQMKDGDLRKLNEDLRSRGEKVIEVAQIEREAEESIAR